LTKAPEKPFKNRRGHKYKNDIRKGNKYKRGEKRVLKGFR
jgi:hypothetical protein